MKENDGKIIIKTIVSSLVATTVFVIMKLFKKPRK
jgi:hypothetical protein